MTTRFKGAMTNRGKTPTRPRRIRISSRFLPLYVLMVPAVAYFIIFRYLPMSGLIMVFKDYRITRPIFQCDWVGFANFATLFNKYAFKLALRNTMIISLLKIVFSFPAPIVLAIMLSQLRSQRLKRVLQTFYYLPHFISWVVISSLIFTFFAPESGAVTQALQRTLGLNINVLTNPRNFRGTLVVSQIWKEVGWGSIIYLAAIVGIDTTQYEAAIVDGARKYQQILYITLPGILPIMMTMLLVRVGNILEAGFEQVLVMQNSLVWEVSEILETYTYTLAFQDGKHALAATVGLIKAVVGMIMVLVTNNIAKRYDQGVL